MATVLLWCIWLRNISIGIRISAYNTTTVHRTYKTSIGVRPLPKNKYYRIWLHCHYETWEFENIIRQLMNPSKLVVNFFFSVTAQWCIGLGKAVTSAMKSLRQNMSQFRRHWLLLQQSALLSGLEKSPLCQFPHIVYEFRDSDAVDYILEIIYGLILGLFQKFP